MRAIFASDSTFMLVKKLLIYRMMSSNMFINHALTGMNMAYRVMGKTLTNFIINKTAGEVFTSGETLQSLNADIKVLEQRKIGGVANYVVEGLHEMHEPTIQKVYDDLIDGIKSLTEDNKEGHYAIKLTSMITIGITTRLSKAQGVFLEDILDLWGKEYITAEDIRSGFKKHNISHTEEELSQLAASLKFADNNSDQISRVERYANGHLFPLFSNNPFLKRLQLSLGVTQSDQTIFATFIRRVVDITTLSHQRNCLLYVDAEQSYIQRILDSIAHQLTHKFNRGDKVIIMNGFQQYLKRMERQVPLEIEASKKLGYNLGIKLIRGAYMSEERRLAKEQGYESPIQETIEDTHRNYNKNMALIFANLRPNDKIFLGSHNQESCELAKKLFVQHNLAHKQVNFGQLKAFSDQITGVLSAEGYNVYKYLPYGPTETVMPYLVRRGQESKQVLREQRFQNEYLKAEIKRRLTLGNYA
ncbi:hypothetical protein FGO68_gene8537 [Halteria grandinella]|uniref:Proline dehydrogenase n=1 Tax=Halteria grandinella TaxID=5974 RepID=A0A8J8NYV5_HALGN|nr:hypothetical protein FGO68_gene8537 [Halteria grandinella]